MSNYILNDSLRSLWLNIDSSHLAYLQEDHSPAKLEQKRRLEGLIKQFLLCVPPQNKFFFPTTSKVLRDSILKSNDFKCYKTVSAWQGIANYAQNLLTQPWRKEFRVIKLFNGYYKHNIEKSLIGGEHMLELMGYRRINRTVLIFEDPIDPDRVTDVSKDSLIASVECQIIRSIYSEVHLINRELQWLDILIYREFCGGNIEDAIKALTSDPSRSTPRFRNSVYYYQPHLYQSAQNVSYAMPHQVLPTSQAAQTGHDTDRLPYSPQAYDYHCIAAIPRSTHISCPTGQLIEYESPPVPSQSEFFIPQHPCQHNRHQGATYHRRSSSDFAVSSGFADNNYSNHGRRQSCLLRTSQNTWNVDQEVPLTINQEFLSDLPLNDYISKYSYSEIDGARCIEKSKSKIMDDLSSVDAQNQYLKEINAERVSQDSSIVDESKFCIYPNVDNLELSLNQLWKGEENVDDSNTRKDNVQKKKIIPMLNTTAPDRETHYARKTSREVLYTPNLKVNLDSPTSSESKQWSCQHCTYFNSVTKEVCTMCGKSQTKEVDAPLASGGRQCPKCTLVNKRGALTCDVCDNSLKDSPTYI